MEYKRSLKKVIGDENLAVMGDQNAVVRENNLQNIYGLENTNERGKRLIQFCSEHELIITNKYMV